MGISQKWKLETENHRQKRRHISLHGLIKDGGATGFLYGSRMVKNINFAKFR